MLHFISQVASLTRDLIHPATPAQILDGRRMFRPFSHYQNRWLAYFYPQENLQSNISSWQYLQKFMMPLIIQRASSYHLKGIEKLSLDNDIKPDFDAFSERFYQQSGGFEVQRANDEIEPLRYFQLISERKFPCIERVRSHDELFCANEPDFWHEAIGHLAPLCFPEVQDFYIEMAHHILAAKNTAAFELHMAVAWTLLEYGFLMQNGQQKMFGAALVGSHLAHMRYQYQHISIEPADRKEIIDSGFYTEHTPIPRNHRQKMRFFCMDDLSCGHLFA